MKKSLSSIIITTILLLGGGLALASLTSCENFLNGGEVKQEIEDAIAYNNAKEITVLVQSDVGTGTVVPNGNYNAKQGYAFEINFTEASSYSFIKWIAVAKDNQNQIITDGIFFEDEKSLETKVKITNDNTSIRIMPLCAERISVVGEPTPRYESNGVSRDRSIIVNFSKDLNPDTFIFNEEELPSSDIAEYIRDEDGKIWAYKYEGQTFLKNISITNTDGYSIAEYFKKPDVQGKLLTIDTDKENPISFGVGETLKTVTVTLSNSITDTDSIKMAESKTWRYQITEATDAKATINFTAVAAEGSINAVSKSYSIGQKIALNFAENTDYQFIEWNYDKEIIYIEDSKNPDTVITVLEKTTESAPTQIKAVCAPRLRITDFSPAVDSATPSVSKNSSIIISFNQNLPDDENGISQLQNIVITIGGAPVNSSFLTPVINANTVTFAADETNLLEVTAGQKKTVSVFIPADFYYQLDDGTKVTYGGKGKIFNYKIDDSTLQKAEITFTASANSGALNAANGTGSYSLGQEVEIAFTPLAGFQFNGWSIKQGNNPVSEEQIKIVDKNALATKLIVYKELKGVTVTANASEKLTVAGSPSSGINPKDSKIELVFNKPLSESCNSLLSEIKIRMNGSNVASYFTPVLGESRKKIILENTKYLELNANETKLITVTVPVSFYYMDGEVKVNLEQEYSFDYEINSSTNAKTDITYSVLQEASGSINQTNAAYDIGTVIDLKFMINDDYKFTGWQVEGADSDEVQIEDTSALSTKLYIKAKASGVSVKAGAYLVPKIISVEPQFESTGCEQDRTVKIIFNKSMKTSSFGRYFNCLSIKKSTGEELSYSSSNASNAYYQTPYFTDGNTVLNIPTIKGKFIIPLDSTSINYEDIIISLATENLKDSQGYSLDIGDTYTHTYRINKNVDNVKPVITDIHLYSTSDENDYFYKELTDVNYSKWKSTTIKNTDGTVKYKNGDYSRNHVSHICLDVYGYDKDSGIKSLIIKETLIKKTDGTDADGSSLTRIYDGDVFDYEFDDEDGNEIYFLSADFDFTVTENGVSKTLDDGLILLEIYLKDKAETKSEIKTFYVIKDTVSLDTFSTVHYYTLQPGDYNYPYDKMLPEYNEETQEYESQILPFNFSSAEDKYYQNFTSQKVYDIELYDEYDNWYEIAVNTDGKKKTLEKVLENFRYNPEILNYVRMTIKEECGISTYVDYTIPKWSQISEIAYTRIFYSNVIRDYSFPKIDYTYQQTEDSPPGDLMHFDYTYEISTPAKLNELLKDQPDGIYKLYVHQETQFSANGMWNGRLITACGKPYVYYKGIEPLPETNLPEIPDFQLPDPDPDAGEVYYEKDTGLARFSVDVDFPEDGYSYFLVLLCTGNSQNSVSCSECYNIEVKNGYDYSVFISVFDSDGNQVKKSPAKTLSLQSVDNIPPYLPDYGLSSYDPVKPRQAYIDSALWRCMSTPYDYDEKRSAITSVAPIDIYLVPEKHGKTLTLTEVKKRCATKYTVSLTEEDFEKHSFDVPLDGIDYDEYNVYFYLKDKSEYQNEILYCVNHLFRYFVLDTIPSFEVFNENSEAKIRITAIDYEKLTSVPDNFPRPRYNSYDAGFLNISVLQNNVWVGRESCQMMNLPSESTDNLSVYEADYTNLAGNFMKINGNFTYSGYNVLAGNVFMKPLYVYPDYYKFKGTADEIKCRSKALQKVSNGYQIFCDAPCFVHTMYCSRKLTTGTTSEDALEWEARSMETGIETSDGIMFTYTDDHLKGIPTGYYYTTIVHFADGTVLMTDVRQK